MLPNLQFCAVFVKELPVDLSEDGIQNFNKKLKILELRIFLISGSNKKICPK